MNRTGLIVALAIAAVVGVVFGLFPQLDLRISQYFYEYVDGSHNVFAWRIDPPVMLARDIGLWIGTLLVVPAVAALVIKLLSPRRKLLDVRPRDPVSDSHARRSRRACWSTSRSRIIGAGRGRST